MVAKVLASVASWAAAALAAQRTKATAPIRAKEDVISLSFQVSNGSNPNKDRLFLPDACWRSARFRRVVARGGLPQRRIGRDLSAGLLHAGGRAPVRLAAVLPSGVDLLVALVDHLG
jgi:hypothetical protein